MTNDAEEKQGGSNLKSNFAEINLKSTPASNASNVISICVVHVKVSYGRTKKQISTYAMVDNCSQGCFMKGSITNNLGADGRKTEITIKNLDDEQKMKSKVMSGLKVRSDSDEGNKRWLDLPATDTKEELPADVDEVATREKIEIWDHVKKIFFSIIITMNIESLVTNILKIKVNKTRRRVSLTVNSVYRLNIKILNT